MTSNHPELLEVGVSIRITRITPRETNAVLDQLPAGTQAAVTALPTFIGGRRFTVEVDGLSIAAASAITGGLLEHAEAVAGGTR